MELSRFLQRGPTKYFLQKKILFHVDLIKMFSLISLFLRFPSYLYMAYLFKLSSRLIVERHLPTIAGADPGGGAHPARAPPKIGKNMIFWHKIVFFHTKYPKIFRASFRSAPFF
jgi:hypothetical protein